MTKEREKWQHDWKCPLLLKLTLGFWHTPPKDLCIIFIVWVLPSLSNTWLPSNSQLSHELCYFLHLSVNHCFITDVSSFSAFCCNRFHKQERQGNFLFKEVFLKMLEDYQEVKHVIFKTQENCSGNYTCNYSIENSKMSKISSYCKTNCASLYKIWTGFSCSSKSFWDYLSMALAWQAVLLLGCMTNFYILPWGLHRQNIIIRLDLVALKWLVTSKV